MKQKQPSPVHPGTLLKEEYMIPLDITVTELAANLGVSRKNLSILVNGHMGVSPEMAMRLAKAFNTTAEFWLNLQVAYELHRTQPQSAFRSIKAYPTGRNQVSTKEVSNTI
ncbi:MAG: HigA family addiction module antitoxin [Sediminibacterium sp.]|uniref:HigA family addiction module antitoxin n=1 Tax=Sediminibacterium sp. TaxID=1917865 RepID=UPI002ABB49B6|nr:HigA family addiction module antitoxin [Sediminibacterium sp.]MDZ4071013.1 HigA family addiction module antitoxin [Sediminibacterium sp.]